MNQVLGVVRRSIFILLVLTVNGTVPLLVRSMITGQALNPIGISIGKIQEAAL